METNAASKEGPICQVLIGGTLRVAMAKCGAIRAKAVISEGHGPVWFAGVDEEINQWVAIVFVTGPTVKRELGMEQADWLHPTLRKRYEALKPREITI
jgi:hypothetical protein